MERESEAGGKVGSLDAYEIEGGETKSEILQNLTEFQFSCVSPHIFHNLNIHNKFQGWEVIKLGV